MNISELKNSWDQQKRHFEDQLISEEEILFIVQQDFAKQVKVRRLLYNASSFVLLLIFCQTC
jgi:hypothetical protein